MIGALADLVLPVECNGCGAAGRVLCARCTRALAGPMARVEFGLGRPGLPPCAAVARYSGAVRNILLAFKENDRRVVTRPLAEALGRAVVGIVDSRQPILLVPVPSSVAAARRRGGDHVQRLTRGAVSWAWRQG